MVARSYGLKPAIGQEALIGQIGRAKTALEPDGMVFVDGALWEATVEGGAVPAGERVAVIGVDGLHLRVRPVGDAVGVEVSGPATGQARHAGSRL
jgi:membrane-bound serine protease (ClpP class)